MKEKYRDKILEDLRKEEESENENVNVSDAPVNVVPQCAPAPVVPVVPVVPEAPAPAPQCVKKPRKKPAAKIIVEQDSDDSDFFEDKPNIIFVKRVTKKKENILPTPTYTPTPLPVYPRPSQSPNPVPVPQYAPPVPVRPPEISPQQRLLMERCKNMSNGNFLPVSRPRM